MQSLPQILVPETRQTSLADQQLQNSSSPKINQNFGILGEGFRPLLNTFASSKNKKLLQPGLVCLVIGQAMAHVIVEKQEPSWAASVVSLDLPQSLKALGVGLEVSHWHIKKSYLLPCPKFPKDLKKEGVSKSHFLPDGLLIPDELASSECAFQFSRLF